MSSTPTQQDATRFDVRAAIEAGLAAGVVFLVVEFLAGLMGASTPLGPATFTMQTALQADTAPATTGLVWAGIFLHFVLALATAFVLARIIHGWVPSYALATGMLFGAVLYAGNVVLFVVIRPELGLLQDTAMFIGYIVFGAAAAWVYQKRRHRGAT